MRRPVNGQWSESEVAKLHALAQKMPVHDLVKELRRSRGAITAKHSPCAFRWTFGRVERQPVPGNGCKAVCPRSVLTVLCRLSSRCGIAVTSW
jgi:hypothetical protein